MDFALINFGIKAKQNEPKDGKGYDFALINFGIKAKLRLASKRK